MTSSICENDVQGQCRITLLHVEIISNFSLGVIRSAVVLHCSDVWQLPTSTPVHTLQFPAFIVRIQHDFHHSPSTISFSDNTVSNLNRPTIFFIQHCLICSHLTVTCSADTVSMEAAQVVLNPYQTFHPQLVGNWITILSAKIISNQPVIMMLLSVYGVLINYSWITIDPWVPDTWSSQLMGCWHVLIMLRHMTWWMLQMVDLLKEYIDSGDLNEAMQCLQELDVPHFHHELVYQVYCCSAAALVVVVTRVIITTSAEHEKSAPWSVWNVTVSVF